VIRFQKLFDDVQVPHRFHEHDAAFDVYAYEDRTIQSMQWELCKTGLLVELPDGYVAQVLSRSGMASKHGVFVLNAPGLVDPNFRGELGVTLMNVSQSTYEIKKGDRIAQLLVVRYAEANSMEVKVVGPPPDDRGAGGFGSTGR